MKLLHTKEIFITFTLEQVIRGNKLLQLKKQGGSFEASSLHMNVCMCNIREEHEAS